MSSELTTRLIEYDSMKMDLELDYACPSLNVIPTLKDDEVYLYGQESISTHEPESQPDAKAQNEEGLSSSYDPPSPKASHVKKHKKIEKNYISKPLPQDSDFSSSQRTVRARRNKDMKNSQYPTKNFLPNFKGPHLQYLERYIGPQVNNLEFIQYLRKKDGISLRDYEQLYQTPEFHDAFESMFRCKYLYRDLLLSRSDPYTKKIHQRKVHVFEDAFKAQSFTRINY